jgi:hypothetical protein
MRKTRASNSIEAFLSTQFNRMTSFRNSVHAQTVHEINSEEGALSKPRVENSSSMKVFSGLNIQPPSLLVRAEN